MAYRFLLEVPRSLAAEASVAVEGAGDAQVVLVRDGHGLGFDDQDVDLTVASHSLRVIDAIYGWFDTLGASRPDVRLVLHAGERLSVESVERGAMVAAIRRDQPWVERTLPKIGDHEEDVLTGGTAASRVSTGDGSMASVAPVDPLATAAEFGYAGEGDVLNPYTGAAIPAGGTMTAAATRRTIQIQGLNHVAIRVTDLAKAEQFYADFLGMRMLGRAIRVTGGGYQTLPGDYDAVAATRDGTEADVTFMRGGTLTLALQRAGRGARIDRASLLDHLSVTVDAATFANLRGEILMRGLDPLTIADRAITFRDPFGVVWEAAVLGTPGMA
ncbi:MAG: VOC family protein [Chloroflexia bacterium]|nr:VOC family protein [Chloroflexia bacterium]MDQ3513009.1 VOC family protein [Chloroflexota bacterium]